MVEAEEVAAVVGGMYGFVLGKNVELESTRFAITLKLGLPSPVAASQPGAAANEYSQQLLVSRPPPAPQALFPVVTSLKASGEVTAIWYRN